jgi:hypothetical protein
MPAMTPRAVEQRPVFLRVDIGCRGCARSVQLSGPLLRTPCASCGLDAEIGAAVWLALFREIDERSFPSETPRDQTFESSQPTAAGTLGARWRAAALTCAKCQREMTPVEPGTNEAIECSACGTRRDTFPAPAWLRTELPTAMQLYGAARDGAERAGTETGFWITFQGTPPSLSDQHRQAIQSAIGPAPISYAAPLSVPNAAPRRRWEWLAIALFAVLIGAAVYRCGGRMGTPSHPDDGSEVEPSP